MLLIDTIVITSQGLAPAISQLLNGILSKYWLCTRVIHALLHWHRYIQLDIDLYACTRDNIMYQHAPISLPPNIRSSSSLSLSPCRLIPVPLKFCSCHNPKHSSKVPSTTASNRPKIQIAPRVSLEQSRSGTYRG